MPKLKIRSLVHLPSVLHESTDHCSDFSGSPISINRNNQLIIKSSFFKHKYQIYNESRSKEKDIISDVLTRYNLSIHNMRGQGYDGASNMRGAFNGLQALFLRYCPYAYYVHCFAHRLQLALVGAAEKQDYVWDFFSKLANVVNIVTSSSKRLLELQTAHGIEVDHSVASGEREIGRGLNQIGHLQRAGSTRWSSHFNCVCSLIDKYGSIIVVLESIVSCSTSSNTLRGEARGSLKALKSFNFLFVLYLMHKIMGITDLLFRALQSKSIDILNAMDLVATTKELLQSLRDEGFDVLLHYVISVCEKFEINVPDMSARYMDGIRSVRQRDDISVEHHYHYDVFNSDIDFQLEELQYMFNDNAVELLRLSLSLEPKNNFRLFDKEQICTLASTFYPADFSQQEMYHLQFQLDHYNIDVIKHAKFQNLSNISELCLRLVDTGKAEHYNLIHRLICLVLTFPLSTATTKRVFSAMKLVKTVLRNKMDEEYLRDSMVINIEREFAEDIDPDEVIDEFYAQKNRRVLLK